MKLYLDSDYKCHTDFIEGMKEAESTFFDGKCGQFVEGYRFIPFGESWVREDGTEFHGEMVAPWKDYSSLAMAQEAYDEANSLLNIITEGVPSDDES